VELEAYRHVKLRDVQGRTNTVRRRIVEDLEAAVASPENGAAAECDMDVSRRPKERDGSFG
jgi:hypothetical protein